MESSLQYSMSENTEKRLESQVKLRRIMIKVHKSVSPTPKYRPVPYFLIHTNILETHATRTTHAKVSLTPPANSLHQIYFPRKRSKF